jgi:quercetin dioxygenase-like cupin family protein
MRRFGKNRPRNGGPAAGHPTQEENANRKPWENDMDEKPVAPKGKVINLENHIAYAAGSVVSKTLVKRQMGNVTLFAFDEGQGLSEHTAPFDAFVHILDGKAEITIGGESRKAGKGDMVIMPAGVPHAFHAGDRCKMLLVMIRGE